MTDTELLIRLAAREIGIGDITITAAIDRPGEYDVTFKDRRGDEARVEVVFDTPFPKLHDQLKAAFKPNKKDR